MGKSYTIVSIILQSLNKSIKGLMVESEVVGFVAGLDPPPQVLEIGENAMKPATSDFSLDL